MRKVWILCALLLVAATKVSGQEGASVRQDDPFILRHDRDASTNPLPFVFTISFADDRRAFRVGETITLTFRFYRWLGPTYHANQYCLEFGGSQAVFDRSDGITIPHQPMTRGDPVYCGFSSGVRGGIVGGLGLTIDGLPPPLTARPLVPQPEDTYTAYLNHVARFDRPGHYRFYATSAGGSTTAPPFASNILELDILPTDEAWERQTLAAAVQALDADPSSADAVAALRFLGTRASAAEIARRFDNLPRSHSGDWRLALSAAPHRQRTIQLMEAEIDRADRVMSDRFIDLTAGLIVDERRATDSADRFRIALESLSARRLSALSKVNVLAAELRQSFESVLASDLGLLSATASRGWKVFPNTVERVLHTFSPSDQKEILRRGWRPFSDPAFVRMLRRIVDTNTAVDGPQDAALRDLYEADAQSGRAAILRELAKEHPATTVYSTGVLPDVELPQFDGVLANELEHAMTAVEYRRALERVERYASVGIAGRVRTVYSRWPELHDCESGPVALAYFFRVDPEFARVEVSRVSELIYHGPDCSRGVLFAAAKRRMTPSLEIVAISSLQDPIAYLQTDAVRALGEFGSAKARLPLWDAFERWHIRWRDSGRKWPKLPESRITWDEALGDEFASAIVGHVAWHLDQESVRRARALCLTAHCDNVTEDAEQKVANLGIRAMPRRSLDHEPAFFVSSVYATSRSSLMKFIETFPKSTTFTWHPYWPEWEPDELQKEFGRIKAMLDARGMKLVPFVYPR